MSAEELAELQRYRRLYEEERQRSEALETLAQESLAQDLRQYLDACHSLDLGIQVITDRSLTTQGDTANPAGRVYPQRIVPWEDFAAKQEEVWEKLSASPTFASEAIYPSQHQLAYVKAVQQPISSEVGLRNFEHDIVENAVQKLVDEAYKDSVLRKRLGLRGTITFESHTNLGTAKDSISDTLEGMSISGPSTSRTTAKGQKKPRKARGKGYRADLFCIYRPSEGQSIPVMAIEYKAPHKASVDEIVAGLESEIQPDRDIINKDGQGFSFNTRVLAAAIVTQIFSYMGGKGLSFGYICTGQLFVFLWIPPDPSKVYFKVCIPSLDVMDGDENRLHQTAVAQVFAFAIQALCAKPPSESWRDKFDNLGIWEIEYEDILSKIPPSERKQKAPRESPYKPQHWKGFSRSPIKTRSGCRPTDDTVAHGDDDNANDPPSPTPGPSAKIKKAPAAAGSASGRRTRNTQSEQQQSEQNQQRRPIHASIEERPYCTQRCLIGLATKGPLDPSCPNIQYHGRCHIDAKQFRCLMRTQLATDRGDDANCQCIYLGGAHGMLFKVRLSSHGYTLVAKGMRRRHRGLLLRERKVYSKLQPLQGQYVPVCLGNIDLELPCRFDEGIYHCFLFLSWVGPSLSRCITEATKPYLVQKASMAMRQLHAHGVLHRDAATRNMLYNARSDSVMFVDFSMSELYAREPLKLVSSNTPGRKRNLGEKEEVDKFAEECEAVVNAIKG